MKNIARDIFQRWPPAGHCDGLSRVRAGGQKKQGLWSQAGERPPEREFISITDTTQQPSLVGPLQTSLPRPPSPESVNWERVVERISSCKPLVTRTRPHKLLAAGGSRNCPKPPGCRAIIPGAGQHHRYTLTSVIDMPSISPSLPPHHHSLGCCRVKVFPCPPPPHTALY